MIRARFEGLPLLDDVRANGTKKDEETVPGGWRRMSHEVAVTWVVLQVVELCDGCMGPGRSAPRDVLDATPMQV
jgi:hypothetical protein